MADLFEEIKEDLQHEKWANLWKKYGKFVIGLAIAVVVGTSIGVVAKRYNHAQYEKEGELLYDANIQLKEGKIDQALITLDNIIQNGKPANSAIASMRKVVILKQQNKLDEANTELENLANNNRVPIEFSHLAKLLLSVNKNTTDGELTQGLDELIKKGSPWRYSALEIKAFNALENDKKEEALELFKRITEDEASPQNIRARAKMMIQTLSKNNS